MASFMERAGSFVGNPFGLGDAANSALEAIGIGNGKQVRQGQQSLDQMMEEARNTGAANKQLFNQYLGQAQDLYGGDVQNYNTLVDSLSKELQAPADSFGYTKDISEFYDPAANQRAAAAMSAIKNSAAGGGSAWSSDTMGRMAAKQQALASDEWKASYDRMMADRQAQLNEWNAGQASKQNRFANLNNLLGKYSEGRTNYGNALGDYYGNMASQNNATLQTLSDLTQARTNLGMQQKSGVGAAAGIAGDILGAIF